MVLTVYPCHGSRDESKNRPKYPKFQKDWKIMILLELNRFPIMLEINDCKLLFTFMS